jgi:PAS domain S-box-containing protein
MPEERTSGRWWAVSTIVIVISLSFIEFSSAPRSTLQRVSDAGQVVLCLICGWLCLRAGKRGAAPARRFWRLLGAGTLTWTAAQAIWTWQAAGLDPARLPTVTDFLFWVALVPWLFAPLARPDRPRVGSAGLWFDAALVAVLALHIYAYSTLGSLLAGRAAVYVAWPIVFWYVRDGLVIGAFLWMFLSSAGPWRRIYGDLFVAMLFLHGGDTLSNLFIVTGRYHPGLLDLPWTLPFVWIGITALEWNPGPEFAASPMAPDWRHTRRGALTAILAVVLVPVSHLAYRLWIGPGQTLVSFQAWLTLATTVLIGALFARRQLQLLRNLERVQAEREGALRRSEERFQKAFAASPAVLSLSTRDEGRYLDVNDRCLEMLGYSRDEMLGRTAGELGIWIDPEARARLLATLQEHGRVREHPARFRTRAGEVREVVSSVELVEIDGVPCLLGLTEDMTERRRLEARLVQSQRMESMGRLAGGIAHDFNNLLGVILGYASLVLGGIPREDPAAARVLQIQRAGERAAALTRQLLAFSSRQVLLPELIDLGVLVHDAEKMLGRLIGEDVELVVRVPPGLAFVRADPSQLEQVLMNLVVNARDAMPEGGRLLLELSELDVASALPLDRDVLPAGRYVVLMVRDTGTGISEAVRPHLFEPFFTTKERGKGTGLGLATVHGIVEQSGGRISVESAVGAGTTFRIYLPRLDEVPAGRPLAAGAAPPRGSETVLVVEDDESLRELTREVLSEAGYRVLCAENGAQALEMAAAHPETIHLLLTDVVMPGLSGPKTAERLVALRPGVRVLFASGYTAGELGPYGVLDPSVAFVQKPVSPGILVARVREVLDA